MRVSKKSQILIAVQFACIFSLILLARFAAVNIISLAIITFGSAIGLWSVLAMRKSSLQIIPEVNKGALLITDGPYRFLRHPMYTSVLVVCLGLTLVDMTILKVVIYAVLWIDLLVKIQYEESMLKKKFSGYKSYMSKTSRLIPLVY